jgi:hypothetical protein
MAELRIIEFNFATSFDSAVIAYGFTLMALLDRLEDLP